MRMKKTVFVLLAVLVPFGLLIAWNHHVAPIPSSIDLSKIIPGKTTVGEFARIVGTRTASHGCGRATIFKTIYPASAIYGRMIVIDGSYVDPLWERRGLSAINLEDEKCIVRNLELVVNPVLDDNSANIFERYTARFLNWEYYLFSR